MSNIKQLIRANLGLYFLIPYSFLVVFLGLSNSVLQVDEGADTFVSSTILKYSLPYHHDGVNSTMEYAKVRNDGLFVYRTWVPYYLQASSLSIFGQTTFAARLPFALCGVISAIVLYFFSLKLTRNKSVAFLATLFLISSVPALIYFRTARYVGLPILMTVSLLYSYITIYDKKSWNPWPLTIISILYFHIMYVAFAGIVLGVLIHFFINRKSTLSENYRLVNQAAIITAIFTLPWLWLNFPVFEKISEFYLSTSNQIDTTGWRFLKNLIGFFFQLNNYIFPLILLPLLLAKPLRPYRNEMLLCLCCITGLIFVSLLHSIPLQQYIVGSFPLWYILLALLIVEGCPGRPAIRSIFTAILIFTNLIHIGPLLSVKASLKGHPELFRKNSYVEHAYKSFDREVRLRSVFYNHLFEISNTYKGPLDKVITFFKTHGKPGDSCYIDNEAESLAYYTRMKVIHRDDINEHDTPNWIVLRGDYWDAIEEKKSSPIAKNLQKILNNHHYSKIELDAPPIRVNNTYDIQIHLFRSPSSADKINVYRLTDRPSKKKIT